jgi:hypothetical protein
MSTPTFDPQAAAAGFGTTWRRVITEPRAFFATMPATGGLAEPLGFLAACAALNALGMLLVTFSPAAFVTTLLGEIVWAFALAAVVTLAAQHLFDGPSGFEGVFRAVAYAAAATVFAWVPRIGVVALVYTWYLAVRGVERVEGFDATRAVLTVAIGVVVVRLLGAALAGDLVVHP